MTDNLDENPIFEGLDLLELMQMTLSIQNKDTYFRMGPKSVSEDIRVRNYLGKRF